MTVICDICGRIISEKEKRLDGLPAGVGFQLQSGQVINVCTECILAFSEHPRKLADHVVKIIQREDR